MAEMGDLAEDHLKAKNKSSNNIISSWNNHFMFFVIIKSSTSYPGVRGAVESVVLWAVR